MQAILRLKDKALQRGYTREGWRYLVAVEMGLRPGEPVTLREMAVLSDRASDVEFAQYCNGKARPQPDADSTISVNDLFE